MKRVPDWVWALGVTRGRNVFVLGSRRGRHLSVGVHQSVVATLGYGGWQEEEAPGGGAQAVDGG